LQRNKRKKERKEEKKRKEKKKKKKKKNGTCVLFLAIFQKEKNVTSKTK
jgi:hypothetical protein